MNRLSNKKRNKKQKNVKMHKWSRDQRKIEILYIKRYERVFEYPSLTFLYAYIKNTAYKTCKFNIPSLT